MGWLNCAMGTVDDYLDSLDAGDRAVIAHVYDVARSVVADAEQGRGYGMPALTYRGKPLLSVMRARKHIGLYPFSGSAVDAVADDLAGFDFSKGTIRFQPEHPLPDDVLRRLVEARRAEIDAGVR